eukprot:UN03980
MKAITEQVQAENMTHSPCNPYGLEKRLKGQNVTEKKQHNILKLQTWRILQNTGTTISKLCST